MHFMSIKGMIHSVNCFVLSIQILDMERKRKMWQRWRTGNALNAEAFATVAFACKSLVVLNHFGFALFVTSVAQGDR